jgi:hypothetical protein
MGEIQDAIGEALVREPSATYSLTDYDYMNIANVLANPDNHLERARELARSLYSGYFSNVSGEESIVRYLELRRAVNSFYLHPEIAKPVLGYIPDWSHNKQAGRQYCDLEEFLVDIVTIHVIGDSGMDYEGWNELHQQIVDLANKQHKGIGGEKWYVLSLMSLVRRAITFCHVIQNVDAMVSHQNVEKLHEMNGTMQNAASETFLAHKRDSRYMLPNCCFGSDALHDGNVFHLRVIDEADLEPHIADLRRSFLRKELCTVGIGPMPAKRLGIEVSRYSYMVDMVAAGLTFPGAKLLCTIDKKSGELFVPFGLTGLYELLDRYGYGDMYEYIRLNLLSVVYDLCRAPVEVERARGSRTPRILHEVNAAIQESHTTGELEEALRILLVPRVHVRVTDGEPHHEKGVGSPHRKPTEFNLDHFVRYLPEGYHRSQATEDLYLEHEEDFKEQHPGVDFDDPRWTICVPHNTIKGNDTLLYIQQRNMENRGKHKRRR